MKRWDMIINHRYVNATALVYSDRIADQFVLSVVIIINYASFSTKVSIDDDTAYISVRIGRL